MIRPFENEADIEYLIESHARIYSQEYHYDQTFKAFITRTVHDFLNTRNETGEQIWILDINGGRQGSVGIVDAGNDIAQLRWFLIESDCRGKGLGTQLLRTAIEFAFIISIRRSCYGRIVH